jgi:hypothetical protein
MNAERSRDSALGTDYNRYACGDGTRDPATRCGPAGCWTVQRDTRLRDDARRVSRLDTIGQSSATRITIPDVI